MFEEVMIQRGLCKNKKSNVIKPFYTLLDKGAQTHGCSQKRTKKNTERGGGQLGAQPPPMMFEAMVQIRAQLYMPVKQSN